MATNTSLHHQPRVPFSAWLGMVLLFMLFGMIAFAFVKASPRGSTFEKKRAEARMKKLEEAEKENLSALTTYAWVDKNKGTARIPVDRAMEIMLAELPNKKPTAAGPIVAPSPSAAPQTSPGAAAQTSPAPNATPAPDASGTPKQAAVEGHDSEAHNQPAAAMNPPPAPPGTQPGPNASPAASVPSNAAQPQVSPSPSVAKPPPGTPLPVPGKTP